MRAILMAAGIGSRISRSVNKPKSTMDVDGTPLIVRTVKMLTDNGIDVAVIVGYRQDDIRNALKEYDVTYYVNPFYRVTNSIASLWFARDFIVGEDIILANADVFWQQDILDDLLSDRHDAVMLADASRVDRGDYFFYVEDGFITKYGKELGPEERTTEYVGIAKLDGTFTGEFKKRMEILIDNERYGLWWENILYEYIDTTPVYVRDVSDYFWAEIDYMSDYNRILSYISTGKVSDKNLN